MVRAASGSPEVKAKLSCLRMVSRVVAAAALGDKVQHLGHVLTDAGLVRIVR